MEEFRGTPGIWDIDINGQTILSDAGYKVADVDLIHGNDSDVSLIVSAPELLEALQLAEKAMVYGRNLTYPEWYGTIHKARAAIAKALGK